ncbi:hypothetical protein OHA25_60410 (plasmid) [Nonomuraea sp. NBC_00507]|uniref:hypothetical protein n=1 Tax=Nonomuraea sp. NBC_00507 TaxID=2976002 RepID=UPI002E19458E
MTMSEAGRVFRAAWINGVRKHYPGEPKAGYVTPWEETPQWEQDAATAVAEQVHAFIKSTNGTTAKLTREQRGRFIAICWTGQIYKHFVDPKPSYVADWDDLPAWQKETDADIFDHIEQSITATT